VLSLAGLAATAASMLLDRRAASRAGQGAGSRD